jgi:hypothetical protein
MDETVKSVMSCFLTLRTFLILAAISVALLSIAGLSLAHASILPTERSSDFHGGPEFIGAFN